MILDVNKIVRKQPEVRLAPQYASDTNVGFVRYRGFPEVRVKWNAELVLRRTSSQFEWSLQLAASPHNIAEEIDLLHLLQTIHACFR